MKVLLDFHHQDLYYSLQLLFEKRFGFEVYRPIGLDWYYQKLWNIYPHPATAAQYLSTDNLMSLDEGLQKLIDSHGPKALPNLGNKELSAGFFFIPDVSHINPLHHKAITLEAFKNTTFDFLVCSVPQHIHIYENLQKLYQPQAKIIFQAGNNFGSVDCSNLLTSAKGTRTTRSSANSVFYHQEFDLSVFKPIKEQKNKTSIMNLQHIAHSIQDLINLKHYLPNWNIKAYGAANVDGPADPSKLHELFNQFGFTWHVKAGGDGYGYNIHHSFACGTPMLIHKGYVSGQTADDLFIPGKTVINVAGKNNQQIAQELLDASENYDKWSYDTYNRFKEIVDFEIEFQQIKSFMERLQ